MCFTAYTVSNCAPLPYVTLQDRAVTKSTCCLQHRGWPMHSLCCREAKPQVKGEMGDETRPRGLVHLSTGKATAQRGPPWLRGAVTPCLDFGDTHDYGSGPARLELCMVGEFYSNGSRVIMTPAPEVPTLGGAPAPAPAGHQGLSKDALLASVPCRKQLRGK